MTIDLRQDAARIGAARDPQVEHLLRARIDDFLQLSSELENLKTAVKTKQAALDELALTTLPELMDQLGDASRAVMYRGFDAHVQVDDFAKCSLDGPTAMRRAVDFVKREGQAAVLETEVKVAFGKGQLADALKLVADLSTRGVSPLFVEKVNTSTYKALVRKAREAGRVPPEELEKLGIFSGRRASLVLPESE